MRKVIADCFVIVGIGLVAGGVWLAWPDVGFVGAGVGVGLILYGVFVVVGDL